jgi:hypothetical protein
MSGGFDRLALFGGQLQQVYRDNAKMRALIERFFIEYPDIEENQHLSGADMIQFVTLWMHDARVIIDMIQPTGFL